MFWRVSVILTTVQGNAELTQQPPASCKRCENLQCAGTLTSAQIVGAVILSWCTVRQLYIGALVLSWTMRQLSIDLRSYTFAHEIFWRIIFWSDEYNDAE